MAHRFAVWAPRAAGVEVVIGDRRRPLSPVGRGWWAAEVSGAGLGSDYAFSVDGGPPRPDPRSGWQPGGVDGPSRVVDHGAFPWGDQAWRGLHLRSAVLYELHVGTFTPAGTFDAAIDRLDHLVALGVDGIELLPVAEFSGERGWGYDGVDLFAPHHAYGGPDGLKRLVDACHCRGLGVVMDVVYNHLGPAGNYLAEFGPYFTDRHSTNWGDAVNFDGADSGGVRSFVIANAEMWLRDYHCDGLRLDAVHAIKDESARPIVEELAEAVHRLGGHLGRPLFVIAESDLNDPRFIRSREAGGYGVDAAWADEFHHALHAVLSGEVDGYYADFGSLAQLATALHQAWVFTGEYSEYRRRVHGRPALGIGGERFVVFLQNHDQVGNRATGDRIAHMARVTPGRAKIGAALTVLAPFVPLLFQGEEWAASAPFLYFTDHRDPVLGAAVSEGRRREFASFGWAPSDVPDPQDPATFARSKLDWGEVDPASGGAGSAGAGPGSVGPGSGSGGSGSGGSDSAGSGSGGPGSLGPGSSEHASMLAWYRRLISLRRAIPALTDGRRDRVVTSFDEKQRWLVMSRGPVTVAANLGGQVVALPVPSSGAAGAGAGAGASMDVELLAGSDPGVTVADRVVVLPPDSVAVLRELAAGRDVSEPFAT